MAGYILLRYIQFSQGHIA